MIFSNKLLAFAIYAFSIGALVAPSPSIAVEPPKQAQNETLRNLKSFTSRKLVLMPVIDSSGQGSALADFATEVINQSVRQGGLTTIAWFKVNKTLKSVMSSGGNQYPGNPYASAGRAVVSDENMNELIIASKKLGGRYIIRPVIMTQSNNTDYSTSINPIGMFFGLGASTRTKAQNNAQVDIKIDIISTSEEDIIASKTFSGRSAQVTKERANRLDGITGMQVFGSGSQMDQTKIAFYDTIDKIVELLQEKTQ